MTESFHGRIEEKTVGQGSKSERKAVVLKTDEGQEFVLRVQGDNPFVPNATLAGYAGRSVTVEGQPYHYMLIVASLDAVRVDPSAGGPPPAAFRPF